MRELLLIEAVILYFTVQACLSETQILSRDTSGNTSCITKIRQLSAAVCQMLTFIGKLLNKIILFYYSASPLNFKK